MTLVLIRDDDANATTDPDRLQRAYDPLLDRGIRINFSVVPAVRLDTLAPDGQRERFISEDWKPSENEVELGADTALSVWLRRQQPLVDVFVHGLSHGRVREQTEFGALSFEEAAERIRRAIQIMTQALNRTPIGFVPPWDTLSAGALRAVLASFDLASMGWIDRRRLPVSAWPAHVLERISRQEAFRIGRAWLLRHRGGRITPTLAPDRVEHAVRYLEQGADIAVINLHHWMFWNGEQPHPVICALAESLRGRTTGTVLDAVHLLDSLPRIRIPPLARLLPPQLSHFLLREP
jgi:hypothetical protein